MNPTDGPQNFRNDGLGLGKMRSMYTSNVLSRLWQSDSFAQSIRRIGADVLSLHFTLLIERTSLLFMVPVQSWQDLEYTCCMTTAAHCRLTVSANPCRFSSAPHLQQAPSSTICVQHCSQLTAPVGNCASSRCQLSTPISVQLLYSDNPNLCDSRLVFDTGQNAFPQQQDGI
jgi:hypothetical protein